MTEDSKPPTLDTNLNSADYFKEKYEGNKSTFFSLLNRVQSSFISFKESPNDEDIERMYRGYVANVNDFNVGEKKTDNILVANNVSLNGSIDKMVKVVEADRKLFSRLKKRNEGVIESDNSFKQTYTDSVYTYNYNLVYGTSLVAMVVLMVYSAK